MKRLFAFILAIVIMFSFIIPINLISRAAEEVGPNMVFPYNITYMYGMGSQADDQEEAVTMLLNEWNEWKSQRITASGAGGFKRVQRDGSTNYDTVSEGIGYGMLLSLFFEDRALFDDLYRYAKLHFNENGLMSWHLDASGNVTTDDKGSGSNSAADGDMAVSLLFAFKKWGNDGAINYETEAKALLNAMLTYDVDSKYYILKPGDQWEYPVTNPSYYSTAWYKIFQDYTKDVKWGFVRDNCFQTIYNCRSNNKSTGLIPDWCKSNGLAADNLSYDYKSEAVRLSWRLAVDYSWNRGTDPKNICDAITKFFMKKGVEAIGDGYTITGTELSGNRSSAFMACLSAGSMTFTGYDPDFVKALYEENIKVKDPVTEDPKSDFSYYGNTLRLLSLLYTTGNFPNFYNYTAATPTEKPIATPTPIPQGDASIEGYVDADFLYGANAAEAIKSGFKVEVSGLEKSAVTDSKGYFKLSELPDGKYTLKISKANYLTRQIVDIDVNGDIQISTNTAPVKMWAGDIMIKGSQNGAVNMEDIMTISNCFNTCRGDGKYISGYDLNMDNAINLIDIMIVASRFNKTSGDYK